MVVAVVGITSELEGEEMKVSEPGFQGGDRTSLDLPQPEEDLLKARGRHGQAAGGGADERQRAGGELGQRTCECDSGRVVSGRRGRRRRWRETLSGTNNPAGRLPVTFYKGVDQLPNFEDYSMKARTYRYFTGTPLYPFGYGLSYTNVRLQRADGSDGNGECGRSGGGGSDGDQHGHARRATKWRSFI